MTPNESLNKELCIDPKKYSDLIHVKSLVRILEEIAESEQEKMVKDEEEKKVEESKKGEKAENTLDGTLNSEDEPDTPKTEDS